MTTINTYDLFGRATHTAPGLSDALFREMSLTPVEETGTVESPIGWVGHVHLSRDDIAAHAAQWGDPGFDAAVSPGHYLVHINEIGQIRAEAYLSESDAVADLTEAARVYSRWLDDTADDA